MAVAFAGQWRDIPLDDARHWELCAEEMRAVAEAMQSKECRAMAVRIAEGYERLAGHAERRGGCRAQDANPTA
jgi:hypothetical protein